MLCYHGMCLLFIPWVAPILLLMHCIIVLPFLFRTLLVTNNWESYLDCYLSLKPKAVCSICSWFNIPISSIHASSIQRIISPHETSKPEYTGKLHNIMEVNPWHHAHKPVTPLLSYRHSARSIVQVRPRFPQWCVLTNTPVLTVTILPPDRKVLSQPMRRLIGSKYLGHWLNAKQGATYCGRNHSPRTKLRIPT